MENKINKEYILELSNHEVQDILNDMNMIDDKGNCPYTAEEIFKAGVEYAFNVLLNKKTTTISKDLQSYIC